MRNIAASEIFNDNPYIQNMTLTHTKKTVIDAEMIFQR